MIFSSMTFIYFFLPILSIIYLLFKKELQNYVLLFFSIIFYAWNKPEYLLMMFFIILINYKIALYIEKSKSKKSKKILVIFTLFINLFFLFYFKYFNFVIYNINTLFSSNFSLKKIIMPVGISFYTFQSISYIIDVYRGTITAQKDPSKLALYISLFPQLVAGPIVEYHNIEKELTKRKVTLNKVVYGVKRFIIGLSKKVLIANTMGLIVDKIFNQNTNNYTSIIAWLGAFAYTFQIYYDFSGYSDMAIGLGSIFGFIFPENFNYPYISKTITEFWRRWHITLSSWFKNYLYIPLGGNRCSKLRNYINLFIIFLATGIWHGANWTFIIWGIWNGIFNIIEKYTHFYNKENNYKHNILHHIYTMFIVVIGWVFFRSSNISYALNYLKNMFFLTKNYEITYKNLYYIDKYEILIFIIAIICSTPIFKDIISIGNKNKYMKILLNIWLIILLVLSTASIAENTYNAFIYFQF